MLVSDLWAFAAGRDALKSTPRAGFASYRLYDFSARYQSLKALIEKQGKQFNQNLTCKRIERYRQAE